MQNCTSCGNPSSESARFCSQCGAPLATAPSTDVTSTMAFPDMDKLNETSDRQLNAVDAAAVDALPVGHALLVVQRGPGAGQRFLLDAETTGAGRHPDCGVFLDDFTVSRHHADFRRTGDSFSVVDAHSLNGTYVNRERIDEIVLTDGDEVQIGKFRLRFFSGHLPPGSGA